MLAGFLPANTGIIHKRDNTMIDQSELLITVTRKEWRIRLTNPTYGKKKPANNTYDFLDDRGHNYNTFFKHVFKHNVRSEAFRMASKEIRTTAKLTLTDREPCDLLYINLGEHEWSIELFYKLSGFEEKQWGRSFTAKGKNFGYGFLTKTQRVFDEVKKRPVKLILSIDKPDYFTKDKS